MSRFQQRHNEYMRGIDEAAERAGRKLVEMENPIRVGDIVRGTNENGTPIHGRVIERKGDRLEVISWKGGRGLLSLGVLDASRVPPEEKT